MIRYCPVTCQLFIGGPLRPFVITDEDLFRASTKCCPVIAAWAEGWR